MDTGRFEAVIFDLDGTLLNTLEDLASSMNRVLAANGLPIHQVDAYRYFVGDGARTLVKRVVPEEKRDDSVLLEELLQQFLQDYSQNWDVATKPYDGVDELLEGLASKGLKLAVLSNKPHDFTRLCIERFLSRHTFQRVIGERPGIPRKPDPAGALEIADGLSVMPSKCLYLGDTAIDMKTATSAGMFPMGVLWGFRDAKELLDAGAQKLIAHPCELLNMIH